MDKRYKFLRGHAFAGLEDYFASEEIKVRYKDLEYPDEMLKPSSSNGNSDIKPSFKQKLGRFYEVLSQGIHGGEMNKTFEVNNGMGYSFKIRPDLVLGEKFWDAKAVAPSQYLKLPDDQMMRYALLQISKINSKTPEIKVEIFRHGVMKLESKFVNRPIEDLIFQLSQNTKYLISMDLSVAFEYYRLAFDKGNFQLRYDKGNSYTGIRSGDLSALLAYPEESLEKIGINLDNLEIKKRRFPREVRIGDYELNSFPILIIENKNYPEKWIEYFNQIINDENEVPKIFFEDIWQTKTIDNDEDDWLREEDGPEDDLPF